MDGDERSVNRAFVYAVTGGAEYIEELHRSIFVLRCYTNLPVYVLTDRRRNAVDIKKRLSEPKTLVESRAGAVPITLPESEAQPESLAGPQPKIIDVSIDESFSNKEAAILLKTSLLEHLPYDSDTVYCYLDSDVFIVAPKAAEVFGHFASPVSFARDHCSIDRFSPWAVTCGCRQPGLLKEMTRKLQGRRTACSHLRQELKRLFGLQIDREDWFHWNGGLFLFDMRAKDFLRAWHQNTLDCFRDSRFENRDQASLIATTWLQDMQDRKTLASRFNKIVFGEDELIPPDSAFLHLLGKCSSPETPIMLSVLSRARKAAACSG